MLLEREAQETKQREMESHDESFLQMFLGRYKIFQANHRLPVASLQRTQNCNTKAAETFRCNIVVMLPLLLQDANSSGDSKDDILIYEARTLANMPVLLNADIGIDLYLRFFLPLVIFFLS